jgi:tRNA A-37 threonylcarbamoyl transferase component Bud32
VQAIGPKLAEGRDTEIYAHGPGRVLRLARDGRSLVAEADVMRFVAERGYPVPVVYDAGQGYLVMERVTGPTMLASAVDDPEGIAGHGRELARLHAQLHQIVAPDWLSRGAAGEGDRLLHRDLHPLNVILGDDGPMVIDWANATGGDPAYDVADTWVLFATADIPGDASQQQSIDAVRTHFLRSFLGALDAVAARALIPLVVTHRLADRNMTQAERARMRAMSAWATCARDDPPPAW